MLFSFFGVSHLDCISLWRAAPTRDWTKRDLFRNAGRFVMIECYDVSLAHHFCLLPTHVKLKCLKKATVHLQLGFGIRSSTSFKNMALADDVI